MTRGGGRCHFDQLLEGQARVLEETGIEQQAAEVRTGREESRVHRQRIAIVLRCEIRPALALGKHTERVMYLRHVGIQAPRALQQRAGAREVAALHVDQPEID